MWGSPMPNSTPGPPIEDAAAEPVRSELTFDCVGVRAEPYAASPTLAFKLRITDTAGADVHHIALRCQLRIQPQRRTYSDAEAAGLRDLFGERARWGDTLKPLQFAEASLMVRPFRGATEVDLLVPCTYDLEVAASRYFHALGDGEVPMLLLFSGTVFRKAAAGFEVDQIPWNKEAEYGLPVATWKQMMDQYFPGSAWLRLRRETVDALGEFKSRASLLGWDDAVRELLRKAGEA